MWSRRLGQVDSPDVQWLGGGHACRRPDPEELEEGEKEVIDM